MIDMDNIVLAIVLNNFGQQIHPPPDLITYETTPP